MEKNKIFLEGFNSKSAVNTDSELNVSLRGNRRLLPLNDLSEVISSFDIYNEERKACNKIRLTCQVNPVCSNVLFNRITEIVKDEGSSAVTFINYGTTGDKDAFNKNQVVYKSTNMEFWSGNSMNYLTIDHNLSTAGASTKIIDRLDHMETQPEIGSSDLTGMTITSPWHPTNAIRDTQLSRDDDDHNHFVYHCGLDILNNHLIRSNTFKCICKMLIENDEYNYGDSMAYQAFNTIADYMRDVRGYRVIEKLYYPTTAGVDGNAKLLTLHTYLYDDILTFKNAIKERLVQTYNGWIGFYNKSKIKSYEDFSDSVDLRVERPIMYLNGGDFVDMYPGRDLYSFVPKFNHHRQRIEKNWNYCITYPSSSTTEGFDDIFEVDKSLKAIYYDETRRNDNGTKMLVIYSKAKHGLAQGDDANIYKTDTDDKGNVTTTKILDNAEVENVVDDFIFTVYNQNTVISRKWVQLTQEDKESSTLKVDEVEYIKDKSMKFYMNPDPKDTNKYYIINGDYVNFDSDALNISYKKVVNDIECDYYVRIFSRLPNFKYSSGDTSNEYEIYRNRSDEDSRNLIQIYQRPEYEFENHVSRLAFAKNIYADEVGEIVFTDDIDLSYLKDNLGRPLSELFVTIVKNNKGYKEWYGYDRDDVSISNSIVEYSHCFGKVTCGFEMSDQSTCEPGNNNIKKINLVEGTDVGYDIEEINGIRSYKDGEKTIPITSEEIWFDDDINYYGDLCYYDNYNAIERVIQPILHRVNTAQRESIRAKKDYVKRFAEFLYDDISTDDYDSGNRFKIKNGNVTECNSKKEGYYYVPHYQIPIRSFDKLMSIMPDFLTIRSLVNNSNKTTTITTLEKHFLSPGDKSMVYDTVTNKYYYCTTVSGTRDSAKVYTCTITDENGKATTDIDGNKLMDGDVVRYKLFKIDNLDVPSYARILKDGTCRFIWRNIFNNGFNESDKTLEEYPFTNGAFYVNKRIDLYLRRQDPNGLYGLYSEDDIEGITPPIEDENNYIKEDEIEC